MSGFFLLPKLFCALLVLFTINVFPQTELEFLAEKINRGTTEQKRDSLFQIRNLETESASRIAIPALKDSAEIVRATAAFSVVFLPPDEAAQHLLPLLQDKSALVRRETAYALGKVGNSQTINPLLQILQKDKILEVRNASVVALGEIGDVSAVVELTKILQRKPRAKEEFLRRSAARSVGQIAQIIQTKQIRAVTPESFLPEEYKLSTKQNFADLTKTLPAFRVAVGVLIESLQNPSEFQDARREAAFALGTIGDESAISVLRNNLDSQDYYLAEICREAIEKISN